MANAGDLKLSFKDQVFLNSSRNRTSITVLEQKIEYLLARARPPKNKEGGGSNVAGSVNSDYVQLLCDVQEYLFRAYANLRDNWSQEETDLKVATHKLCDRVNAVLAQML
jgi:hypothetical protein